METLLEKARSLEADAQNAIATAEQRGKKAVADLAADEQRVVADIEARAQDRGRAIVAEQVSKAKGEVNTLHQQAERAVQEVHDAGARNRERTVSQVLELLTKAAS